MKANPKVSIIIPVHNSATTLDRCIESIICQNYNNIECILIENGSTDTSEEICRSYAESYDFIQVAVSSQTGVSAARNLGLSIATGDIIGSCDADDFIEPDAIKTVVSEFLNNPGIVGVIGAFYAGRETQSGIQKRYRGLKKKIINVNKAIALTVGNDNVMGSLWNKYYKAEMIKGMCFDTELAYCEDTHFNVNVLSSAPQNSKMMLIDTPLYCYMDNNQSVTHQAHNFFDEEGNLKYIVSLKKILKDCYLNKKCRTTVKRRIFELAIDYSFQNTYAIYRDKLLYEAKSNYLAWLLNLNQCSFKGSIKRGLKFVSLMIGLKKEKKCKE